MKRLVLLSIAICLVAGTASASEFGLRGGLTLEPDQFHIGGHIDLGPVLDPLRIVPNIEIGFGSNNTVIAFNGDLIYDFPDTPWSIGGELGMNYVDNDNADSSTDFGLSVLGDYRVGLSSGKTLLLEAKLGLIDSPDFKFTVGWGF
jgi:hypothetical protein